MFCFQHYDSLYVYVLEKEMATHSSILAGIIPWTEEPGGLHSSWGCKESNATEQLTHSHTHTYICIHVYKMYFLQCHIITL